MKHFDFFILTILRCRMGFSSRLPPAWRWYRSRKPWTEENSSRGRGKFVDTKIEKSRKTRKWSWKEATTHLRDSHKSFNFSPISRNLRNHYQVNFTVPWWWNFMIHCLIFNSEIHSKISKSSIFFMFLISHFFYYISLTKVCEILVKYYRNYHVVTCLNRSLEFLFTPRARRKCLQMSVFPKCFWSLRKGADAVDKGVWKEKLFPWNACVFVCPYNDDHRLFLSRMMKRRRRKFINEFYQQTMKCRSSRSNLHQSTSAKQV